MTVLYIIGFLAVGISLLWIVTYINNYSMQHYSYEFFRYGNLAVVTIAYLMIYCGYLDETCL